MGFSSWHNLTIVSTRSAAGEKSRGGTESIARYLEDIGIATGRKTVGCTDYISGDMIAIGLSLTDIFRVLAKKKRRQFLLVLDVAGTRSVKRILRLGVMRLLESIDMVMPVVLIGSWQQDLYGDPILLDPVEVCKSEMRLEGSETFTKRERAFIYGYVGRICRSKGFYDFMAFAEELSRDSRLKPRILVDLLLWGTEEEEIFLRRYKPPQNIEIMTKEKTIGLRPSYSDIRVLVLPYESICTSIAVPFVPIEAVLSGCEVVLPESLREVFDPVIEAHKDLRGRLRYYRKGKLLKMTEHDDAAV